MDQLYKIFSSRLPYYTYEQRNYTNISKIGFKNVKYEQNNAFQY